MRIPENDIQKILDNTSIVDVVSRYVSLHKRGQNYFGCCPFHNEKTASMCVNAAKGIFKCFGCGEHGNAIWFVSKHEGISYPEAARMLARECHVEIKEEEKTSEEVARDKERESVLLVLDAAQRWFEGHIDEKAEAYISSRKMNGESRKAFRVGATGTYRQLLDELSVSFSEEILKKAGLVCIKDDKASCDYFRHRVMFPYLDNYGRVIGFIGRDISGTANAKYMNSPDTILFKKGTVFFGMYQARQEIARYNKVYLVEGQFDVISFWQNGVKNVLCKSGSALDKTQVKKLHNLSQNVTLVYDDDKAGVHAAVSQIPELLDYGFNVRCVMLPENADPDDFAKMYSGELREQLKKIEMVFVDYLYLKLYKSAADEPTREAGLNTITAAISRVHEDTMRNDYMRTLSRLIGVGQDELMPKLRHAMAGQKPKEEVKDGFCGIDEAKEIYDQENDRIRLTNSWDEFEHCVGTDPVVFFRGCPEESEIQKLRQLDNSVIVYSPNGFFTEKTENDEILLLKELFRQGFNVDIKCDDLDLGFIQWYVDIYSSVIESDSLTTAVMDIYLGRLAEMMAEAS